MKKAFVILSLVLGLCAAGYAQQSSLFSRGGDAMGNGFRDGDAGGIGLPGDGHNSGTHGDANVPLGGGALLLIGFGSAYALSKKNKD